MLIGLCFDCMEYGISLVISLLWSGIDEKVGILVLSSCLIENLGCYLGVECRYIVVVVD